MSTRFSKKSKEPLHFCIKCNNILSNTSLVKCLNCSRDRNNRVEYWGDSKKLSTPKCCEHCFEQSVIASDRKICFLCYVDRKYNYDNR